MSRLGLRPRDAVGVGLFALATVVVLFLPRFISDFRAQQFAYVGIYFIALIGLNVLTGYTGQISLGHGAFMAIGGYTTAILISNQGLEIGGHVFAGDLRDIWTLPIAGLVAGLAGFLFGFPALRLTGLYLALATFAVAVATPAVMRKFESFTGGGAGIDAGPDEGAEPTGAATTVTLRVTVRQAVYLTAAQNFAREVRLLPRPPGDRGRSGRTVVSADGL